MQAGKLRHRVTFEQRTENRNAGGGERFTWQPVCTVSAEIVPLSGKALFAAQQNYSEVTAIIKLRYRPDINSKLRAVYGDAIYSIDAVINVGQRNRELHCMVSTGVKES